MIPIRRRFTGIALGFILFSPISFGLPACNNANISTCNENAKPISEVPQGLIDGHNNVFLLAASPLRNTPVRVFRNGMELSRENGYRVDGRTLTILLPQPLVAGDALNVFYIADLSSQSSANSGAPIASRTTQSHPYDDEISAFLLRRTLTEETAALRVVAERPVRAVATYLSKRASPAVTPENAFKMLSRQLSVADDRDRGLSMDGVEGLGDQSVTAVFDQLGFSGHAPLRQLARGEAIAPPQEVVGPFKSGVPPSIDMLLKKLSESGRTPSRDSQ